MQSKTVVTSLQLICFSLILFGTLSSVAHAQDSDQSLFLPFISAVSMPVSSGNIVPTASAGPNQNVYDNDSDGRETITINAAASRDADGSIVRYQWSAAGLTIADSMIATVDFPVGMHTVILTVTDDEGATDVDVVRVAVNLESTNQPPTANAGPDQNAQNIDDNNSETITINAAASNDEDGSITQYRWRADGITIPDGIITTADFPVGVHSVLLTITDNEGATDSDIVRVAVSAGADNLPPIANAGQNQIVTDSNNDGTETITLDASASIAAGSAIVLFEWDVEEDSDTPSIAIPDGVAPVVSFPVGVHSVFLKTTDNEGASSLDVVRVTVRATRVPAPECIASDARTDLSSYFGVQMYHDTGAESKYFDDLVDSKAGWVRTAVTWTSTERQNTDPSNFDWTYNDKSLALAKYTNITVIGFLTGTPSWATKPDGPFLPGMQDEFVEFVTALVERYDGDGIDDAECSPIVDYWEFYNEPDRNHSWGRSPGKYADMLKAVYPAVKEANPYAQVVFGGVAQDWFTDQDGPFVRGWVQSVLAAGAGPYFDYMNIHAYSAYWKEHADHFPGTLDKVEKYRQILANYGWVKPMLITEIGDFHPTDDDYWLNRRQALYLVEGLTQARIADVEGVTWFSLYDLQEQNYNWYTGLVTTDSPPQRKPAYETFKFLSAMLETAEYVKTLHNTDSFVAYEFDDPVNNRKVVIAWTHFEKGDGVNAQFSLESSQATRYDIFGVPTTLYDSSDGSVDGRIRITVGQYPTIITRPR